MIGRRIARPGVIAMTIVAALAHLGARQAQRDPTRTTPPPAQAPVRDATKMSATGTAVLRGVVVSDESTPRPVRRALVSLAAPGRAGRTTVTDDNGRFVFAELPAGRFTLGAVKPGWVPASYGTRPGARGPGTTIAIDDGQRVSADLTMVRGGVIAGRIVDQFGQPQAGVRPVTLEVRSLGGERALGAARGGASAIASVTDDRGEYRIYGLPPGTYVVAATAIGARPPDGTRVTTEAEIQWARTGATASTPTTPPPPGPPIGYAAVFYPGTSDAAAATPIVISAGAERTGVDFAVLPVPMARVSGTVTRSDGLPAQGAQITLTNAVMTHPYDTTSSRASVSPQGQFTISSVPPGTYRVTARAASQSAAARPATSAAPGGRSAAQPLPLDLYAIAEITVNGRNVDNIAMALQPGTTISGRIAFEGTIEPPANPTRTQIALVPPVAPSQVVSAAARRADSYYVFAEPDRTFIIPGILPGRYAMNVTANALAGTGGQAWALKSIVIGGRDVADVAFEVQPNRALADVVITFSDRSSEISGTIFDGAGRPSPGYFVFVFPTDRSAWLTSSRRFRPPSQPSTDGKYRIADLPPGEYFVAALTEFDQIDLADQTFLEQVAAASIKVTVKDGEKKVQDLKIR